MIFSYTKAIIKGTKFLNEGLIKKKPPLAYIDGFLKMQNLGDEALYKATKLLFNRFNLLHFDGSRSHTLIAKHLPFLKTGLLAGGTIINRIEWWLGTTEKFYQICPNLYIFGTGVANDSFWAKRSSWVNMMDKWKELLKKCEFIGVRGPISAELLIEAGIDTVEVVGDPVLVFAENEISNSYIPNSIGLNIGQSRGDVWGDENSICTEFINLAKLAKKAEWTVKWFVVWPEDLQITKKAAEISETSDEIYETYNDPKQYLEFVKPLSTFVGMKLHATILATCVFVPSIMIEYRPKCLDYMKSIMQESSTFRADEFKAEKVWEIVNFWNKHRNEKADNLFNAVKTLQLKQRYKAESLMNRMLEKYD